MTTKRRSACAIAAVLSLTVMLFPSLASADIVFSPPSGNFGPHFLRDSPEFGGARCTYPEPAYQLSTIRIRPPSVYAFDRTTGADSQKTGWKYIIESSSDALNWTPAVTSRVQKGTATEVKDAPFTARTYAFTGGAGMDYYRVSIRMLWYSQDGTIVRGSAEHTVEYYDIVGSGFPTAVRVEPCAGDTPLVGT